MATCAPARRSDIKAQIPHPPSTRRPTTGKGMVFERSVDVLAAGRRRSHAVLAAMAGYSATRWFGSWHQARYKVTLRTAPDGFQSVLAPLPDDSSSVAAIARHDLVLQFAEWRRRWRRIRQAKARSIRPAHYGCAGRSGRRSARPT